MKLFKKKDSFSCVGVTVAFAAPMSAAAMSADALYRRLSPELLGGGEDGERERRSGGGKGCQLDARAGRLFGGGMVYRP